MSTSVYLNETVPSPSIQNLNLTSVTTPSTVPDNNPEDGRMVTSTKVALVIVPVLFFLLVLGFCLVARKRAPKAPVLPVRRISPTATEKRKSVQRWLDGVSRHSGDVPVVEPADSIHPLYRQPSTWTLSGSTMVGIHQGDPYFQSPLQSPLPAHYRADRPHDFIGMS